MLMFQIDKITIMSKTYIIIEQNVISSQTVESNQKSIFCYYENVYSSSK